MSSRLWRVCIGGHAICLALIPGASVMAGVAIAQEKPEFKLGFETLAREIPGVAGQPLENEHHNPENGDTLQRTTMGLMVWRKADNWTAFTDGSRTWINGPLGVQERGNQERFDWEAGVSIPGVSASIQGWVLLAGERPKTAAGTLFLGPMGVAVAGEGTTYVADTWHHRVLKFSPAGQLLAAWGAEGKEPGRFKTPYGVVVDGHGNVIVADTGNARLQVLSPEGALLAVWDQAGTARSIALDEEGNIYTLRYSEVRKFSPSGDPIGRWGGGQGKDPGQFGRVANDGPVGLAVDRSGNVYAVDTWNNRVQKFSPSGALLAVWGGSGRDVGHFLRPEGIAVDSQDRIYVLELGGKRIQMLSTTGQVVGRWDGIAGSALFVDHRDQLWVGDVPENHVLKLSLNGQILMQLGRREHGPGEFDRPIGVAVDPDGNLYVAEALGNRVQKLSPAGKPLVQWGSLGDGPGQFGWPTGIALDSGGNLYVAEAGNHRIQKLSPDGESLALWGRYGVAPGEFSGPQGVALDGAGNVYVADTNNDRVQKLSPSGELLAVWGGDGTREPRFTRPTGVAVDPGGGLYVVNEGKERRVLRLSATGELLAEWGQSTRFAVNEMGSRWPFGIAVDGKGNVYTTDPAYGTLTVYDGSGTALRVWGEELAAAPRPFSGPTGVAIDRSGNIYVASTMGGYIRKHSAVGQ